VTVPEVTDRARQHFSVAMLAGENVDLLVLVREQQREQAAVPESEYDFGRVTPGRFEEALFRVMKSPGRGERADDR
jgi:hypothetical protein